MQKDKHTLTYWERERGRGRGRETERGAQTWYLSFTGLLLLDLREEAHTSH